MDKKQCSSCGAAPHKCSCKNKEFTKAVIEIDNPEQITLMRRVVIPASMGDDTAVPPVVGKYHNVLLYYEANHKSYLYSSDGIPTLLANGLTDYEEAVNLPQINGNTLLGDKTAADLGLQDKLTAGNGIDIDSDNNISVEGIDEYAHYFDTVADMKASSDLVDGDYVKTLGYSALNDMGGACYKISSNAPSGYYEVLNSGLYAELIVGAVANVKQFGAKGDGTNDDTTAFNYVINNYYSVLIPEGTYLVDFANIDVANKSIIGVNKDKCVIKQKNSGTELFTIGARTKLDNFTIDAQNNTSNESILVFGNSYTGAYEISNLYIKCPNSIAINCDVSDGYRVGGIIRDIYIENPYIGISMVIAQGVGRTNYFTRFFISDIIIVNPSDYGILTSCAGTSAQLSHGSISNVSVQLATQGATGVKLSGNAMLNFSDIFTFIEGAGITAQNTYGLDFGDTEFSANLIRTSSIIGAKIEGGFRNEVNKSHYTLKDVEHIINTKTSINNNSVTIANIGRQEYEPISLLKEGKFVEDFDPVGDTNYRASSNFTSYEVKTDFFGKKYVEIVTGTGGLTEYRYSIDFPEESKSKSYITMYAIVEMANTTDTMPLPWIYAVSGEATGTRTSAYIPSTSYPNRFLITKTVDMSNYLGGSAYRFGLSLPASTTVKIYKLDVVRGNQDCMKLVNFD